jgi:hypothetical protein
VYYLYKKSKSAELPEFQYVFSKFDDFYEIAKLLEVPLIGAYYIKIKTDSYKDIINFISVSNSYATLIIYIEVNETLLNYIMLQKPDVQLLESKSNFEVFKELVSKYGILFKKNCLRTMYFSISHSYEDMDAALELLQRTFPDVSPITEDEISRLFVVDSVVYPRNVCIMFLRLDRGRFGNLNKCIDYFGNDLVMYAIRKSARKFLEEKTTYLKTGQGTKLITLLPYKNIVRLNYALDYNRGKFMDIRTILKLYEEGVYVNDTLQERTISLTDEKYYALR